VLLTCAARARDVQLNELFVPSRIGIAKTVSPADCETQCRELPLDTAASDVVLTLHTKLPVVRPQFDRNHITG
jgi:hypothetical protein